MFRSQQEIIQDLKRNLHIAEQEWESARSRFRTCSQAVSQHQERGQTLKIEMQEKEDHLEALRDALDKENAEDGGIEALRVVLRGAEEEAQTHEGSFEDSVTAMTSRMQSLQEARRELRVQDGKISSLEHNAAIAESEKSKVEDKRRKILSDKNIAVMRVENEKKDRDEIHGKREEAQSRVLYYNQEASKISPRVPIEQGETAGSLDEKLTRLKQELHRHNQQ